MTTWIHIAKNNSLGLEEQWVLRYENTAIGRVSRRNDAFEGFVIGRDGMPYNIAAFSTALEDVQNEVVAVARDSGWPIPIE